MDLTAFLQIAVFAVTILSMIIVLLVTWKIRRVKDDVFEYADDMVLKLIEFYKTEKADLAEQIPKMIGGMISKPIMSQMGIKSGVSRQLKGLEKELITQGVGQAVGNPEVGSMVAGLVDKYPIVKQFLPFFLKGRGRGQPQQPQGGNGVGYG